MYVDVFIYVFFFCVFRDYIYVHACCVSTLLLVFIYPRFDRIKYSTVH